MAGAVQNSPGEYVKKLCRLHHEQQSLVDRLYRLPTSTMAAPPFGVYTPLVVYFNDDESLDTATTTQHARRMAQAGVTGLVLQGSNGEAPHILHDERVTLIKSIRHALDEYKFPEVVIIAGCGAASLRETLLYLHEAKESGANFGLLLPPSYWAAAMTPAVVENYFSQVPIASLVSPLTVGLTQLKVAEQSPLPFLLYNFPAVAGGIDLSSDLVTSLAQRYPGKVVGAKLTCGNVGKLQRLANPPPSGPFSVFAGKSDFFLPGLVAGSNGVIAALANVVPKVHVDMLELWKAGKITEAQQLQSKLSHADWTLSKLGVAGVKSVVAEYFGYGSSRVRSPLPSFNMQTLSDSQRASLEAVIDLEKS